MLEHSPCCHLVFVHALINYYFLLMFFRSFKNLEVMNLYTKMMEMK